MLLEQDFIVELSCILNLSKFDASGLQFGSDTNLISIVAITRQDKTILCSNPFGAFWAESVYRTKTKLKTRVLNRKLNKPETLKYVFFSGSLLLLH